MSESSPNSEESRQQLPQVDNLTTNLENTSIADDENDSSNLSKASTTTSTYYIYFRFLRKNIVLNFKMKKN